MSLDCVLEMYPRFQRTYGGNGTVEFKYLIHQQMKMSCCRDPSIFV